MADDPTTKGRCPICDAWSCSCAKEDEPTAEEWAEISELTGGVVGEIVRTPEEEAELERLMEYVDRMGHQPP